MVLDEAQAIKNPGAKQTRAVKALRARAASRSPARRSRTGSAISGRCSTSLTPACSASPKAFSRLRRSGWRARARAGYGPLRELVRPYILRRLKTDKRVIADLPDKTEVRAFCGLTSSRRRSTSRRSTSSPRALDSERTASSGAASCSPT